MDDDVGSLGGCGGELGKPFCNNRYKTQQ